MNQSRLNKTIIFLFDESGTPTFKTKNDLNIFLGVSILYDLFDENKFFDICDKSMGLSNTKPIKNDSLGYNRVIEIANNLSQLNINIVASYINLDNEDLKISCDIYESFGNYTIKNFRGLNKKRNIKHFIHDHILNYCIFENIPKFLEMNNIGDYKFDIFIDNWQHPDFIKETSLNLSSFSATQRIQSVLDHFEIDSKIQISNIKLLGDDLSKRKRFIDSTTSIISRALRNSDDKNYTKEPVGILSRSLDDRFSIKDKTKEITAFIKNFIISKVEETKAEEKSKLILK